MKAKTSNIFLLAALLLTLGAVFGVQLLPPKLLTLSHSEPKDIFLHSSVLADGSNSAEYTSPSHKQWRCNVPENFRDNYFACSLGINLAKSPTQGADLSNYSQLKLKLNYSGNANKVRIAIRNYDPLYSTPEDGNSSKFNAVQIHTHELDQEINLPLTVFAVADWWLTEYNIPLKHSLPDLSNAMLVTIDFGETLPPGQHNLSIEKLELEGEWISTEHWYLIVISTWMLGIFVFSLFRLTHLRKQTKNNAEVINQLSNNNLQLKQETDKFRQLSTVDPLTQLYNRFGIDQVINSLANKEPPANQGVSLFSLVVTDIDHFKRINDQRGHSVGDRVLQQVAKVIKAHLRASDVVGRWGGEEFIIVLPHTNQQIAMRIAELIRSAIFDSQYDPEKPLLVSASFGVSEVLPGEDFASCFQRADQALYEAKAMGRNCCVAAQPPKAEHTIT